MKKILFGFGFIMFSMIFSGVAFAEEVINVVSHEQKNTGDFNCVKTAVITREASMQSSFSKFSTTMTTALVARGTALGESWGMTDAKTRRDSRNTAWNNYKKTAKDASRLLKTEKNNAWNKFKSDSKACKVPVVESESVVANISL
jgi:hypothetical protein